MKRLKRKKRKKTWNYKEVFKEEISHDPHLKSIQKKRERFTQKRRIATELVESSRERGFVRLFKLCNALLISVQNAAEIARGSGIKNVKADPNHKLAFYDAKKFLKFFFSGAYKRLVEDQLESDLANRSTIKFTRPWVHVIYTPMRG